MVWTTVESAPPGGPGRWASAGEAAIAHATIPTRPNRRIDTPRPPTSGRGHYTWAAAAHAHPPSRSDARHGMSTTRDDTTRSPDRARTTYTPAGTRLPD